jgi:hypothetical protein
MTTKARLALRIREQGLTVFGFGEAKAPDAFRKAGNPFYPAPTAAPKGKTQPAGKGPTPIELTPAAAAAAKAHHPTHNGAAESETHKPIEDAVRLSHAVIEHAKTDEGWVSLSQAGKQPRDREPDFTPRIYGHSKLIQVVETSGQFETRLDSGGFSVRARRTATPETDRVVSEG